MTEKATARVVVADDQRVVREGLVGMLALLDHIEVVADAADGAEAVDAALREQADVVLMDLRMPNVDGVEATRRLRAARPTIAVIVLTTFSDDQSIADALAAGAAGYLTKDATADQIAHAIRVVHDGGLLFDPLVQARLVDTFVDRRPSSPPKAANHSLTAREIEVLRLMAQGKSNTELADELSVSAATIKTHINNLFAKLGVRDRAQAVVYAYNTGIATPDPPRG